MGEMRVGSFLYMFFLTILYLNEAYDLLFEKENHLWLQGRQRQTSVEVLPMVGEVPNFFRLHVFHQYDDASSAGNRRQSISKKSWTLMANLNPEAKLRGKIHEP